MDPQVTRIRARPSDSRPSVPARLRRPRVPAARVLLRAVAPQAAIVRVPAGRRVSCAVAAARSARPIIAKACRAVPLVPARPRGAAAAAAVMPRAAPRAAARAAAAAAAAAPVALLGTATHAALAIATLASAPCVAPTACAGRGPWRVRTVTLEQPTQPVAACALRAASTLRAARGPLARRSGAQALGPIVRAQVGYAPAALTAATAAATAAAAATAPGAAAATAPGTAAAAAPRAAAAAARAAPARTLVAAAGVTHVTRTVTDSMLARQVARPRLASGRGRHGGGTRSGRRGGGALRRQVGAS